MEKWPGEMQKIVNSEASSSVIFFTFTPSVPIGQYLLRVLQLQQAVAKDSRGVTAAHLKRKTRFDSGRGLTYAACLLRKKNNR
jgi:hypothetical protein